MVVVEVGEPLRELLGERQVGAFVVADREQVVVRGRARGSRDRAARDPRSSRGSGRRGRSRGTGSSACSSPPCAGSTAGRSDRVGLLVVRVDGEELAVAATAASRGTHSCVAEPAEPMVERPVLHHHDDDRVDRRVRRRAAQQLGCSARSRSGTRCDTRAARLPRRAPLPSSRRVAGTLCGSGPRPTSQRAVIVHHFGGSVGARTPTMPGDGAARPVPCRRVPRLRRHDQHAGHGHRVARALRATAMACDRRRVRARRDRFAGLSARRVGPPPQGRGAVAGCRGRGTARSRARAARRRAARRGRGARDRVGRLRLLRPRAARPPRCRRSSRTTSTGPPARSSSRTPTAVARARRAARASRLRSRTRSTAGCTTVLVGDGASDQKAALLVDVLFAKDGLARWCDLAGVPYHPFTTLADVHAALLGS